MLLAPVGVRNSRNSKLAERRSAARHPQRLFSVFIYHLVLTMAQPALSMRPAQPERVMIDASAEEKSSLVVGIIGMGDMGRLYATKLRAGGWKQINVCDVPSKYAALQEEFAAVSEIEVHENGMLVARRADLLIFSVEAAYLADAVKAYGSGTFGPVCTMHRVDGMLTACNSNLYIQRPNPVRSCRRRRLSKHLNKKLSSSTFQLMCTSSACTRCTGPRSTRSASRWC